MWQRWLWIGLVCVMVLWLPAPVAAQAPLPPVVIPAGERYQGHLATFDQSIVVLGEVDGDVTSWAGSITVHGTVRGDVVSYTGTVELKAGAVVEGNVLSIAGGGCQSCGSSTGSTDRDRTAGRIKPRIGAGRGSWRAASYTSLATTGGQSFRQRAGDPVF